MVACRSLSAHRWLLRPSVARSPVGCHVGRSASRGSNRMSHRICSPRGSRAHMTRNEPFFPRTKKGVAGLNDSVSGGSSNSFFRVEPLYSVGFIANDVSIEDYPSELGRG